MNYNDAINIDDLRRIAQRRLPRIAFDYIEGGAEDEQCLARNASAFAQLRLLPRYLVDVTVCSQALNIFGHRYDSPFGIAPTGMSGLFRPGADAMLAHAAVAANIPFIMSGASTTITLEEAAGISARHVWYQLYTLGDARICEDLIHRCRHAGLQTLVVTVDTPHPAKRERNLRNGFARDLGPGALLSALTHPRWTWDYLRHGAPMFKNYARYAGENASAREVALYMASLQKAPQTWRQLERYRQLWPGRLVVKGILHPADAVSAIELGADGLIVSNHGGRQSDRMPSPAEVFPAIRAAVGRRATLMLDSGLRRGADIVSALALGADYTFVGRSTLYGVVAGGLPGASKAIAILREEVDGTLGQIGCPRIEEIDTSFLLATQPLPQALHFVHPSNSSVEPIRDSC